MDGTQIWKGRKGFGDTVKKYKVPIIVVSVLLVLMVVIILATTIKTTKYYVKIESDRIGCPGLTEGNCVKSGCHYDKVTSGPSCYMKKDSFGYKVQDIVNEADGPKIQLQSTASETPYGKSIEKVTFKVTYLTENILRFQFKDSNNKRYEVPVQKDFPLLKNPPKSNNDGAQYFVEHSKKSDVFHFVVKRKDGTILWDTKIGGLLMSDQYLQIASYLPSENVYGLGEHVRDSLKHDMNFVSWPMFARDIAVDPNGDRRNLYGVHPFYTCLEKSGKSHGVFFLNSNAMEATLMPAPAISFRTIGGILDFFIFVGDNPEHVVQLYTSLIGRPIMPPYWGLGFQLSLYGYNKQSDLEKVLERTIKAKIPQTVQYLDIDHMELRKDFTYDKTLFPDLPQFIKKYQRERSLKWIIILDPAVAVNQTYEPYTSGLKQSVFIKRHPNWTESMFPKGLEDANVTFGKVWPLEYVAFPDFFLDETKAWWKQLIVKYHDIINFDGLWIDMNEPANFETNVDNPDYCESEGKEKGCWSLKCPESPYEDPPYNPLSATGTKRLSQKTLCMDSRQGNRTTPYLHYDVHSLYGWSETQPTLEAAQAATKTRSLVVSRSTYPSSGRYGFHWLGDNFSTFKDMKSSIIGMLEFNLFGIPYVGADVCGFIWDTTPELCKRWMQLGAFYPFFRNHNAIGQKDQDPAALGPEVAEASRKAIERRITLNPYLYTLLYRAYVDGSTVVRPLFHEFPRDPNTWNLGTQFMWGRALLVSPILDEGKKSVTFYLPNDEWWRFLEEKSLQESNVGQMVTEKDADDSTPIHVRGGTILPVGQYDPADYPEKSSNRQITLYIFPKDNKASGELFMDDGVSINTIENDMYALYKFTYENCSFRVSSEEKPNFTGPKPILDKLVVFKVKDIQGVLPKDRILKNAIFKVGELMKNVKEIDWKALDGSCQMYP